MDPVSALGVAGNVIQLVQFSASIIKSFLSFYNDLGPEGLPPRYEDYIFRARDLESSNVELKKKLTPKGLKRPLTTTERDIVTVTDECIKVAKLLLRTLETFKAANDDGRWAKALNAFKASRNNDKIQSLLQQLQSLREQLLLNIVLNLREEITTSAQQIVSHHTTNQSLWQNSLSIEKSILEQVTAWKHWQQNLNDALGPSKSTKTRILPEDEAEDEVPIDKMSHWRQTPLATSLLRRFLSLLEYTEMDHREKRIENAYAKTFEWIFREPRHSDPSWSSFINWLKTANGIYWVTGKPGSGKSTLMKYLVQDPRTHQHLKEWAGKDDVIIASFFFWISGTEKQASQEGLLRTLLFQTLSQLKPFNKTQTAGRWDSLALSKNFSEPWTFQELEQAFRFLFEDPESPTKFCFFVDGLDEFNGDLSQLVSLISKFSSYQQVKFCVSSRPWNIFEDAFGAIPRLVIQDLTYPDIKFYVEARLTANPGFKELQSVDEQYSKILIENVVSKASGVFLWVVVVVKSLLEGLTDGDRLIDLQRRLDTLPPELDDLFGKILNNFDPQYFGHASVLFQIFRSAASCTLISMSLADEDNLDLALRAEVQPMTSAQLSYRATTMKRRLNSRCKGLLEATPLLPGWKDSKESRIVQDGEVSSFQDTSDAMLDSVTDSRDILHEGNARILAHTRVDYLHRTVKDFLERPDIREKIAAATEDAFDPNAALAGSYLLQLKWIQSNPGNFASNRAWELIFWTIEYAQKCVDIAGSQFRILDELESTATRLFTRPGLAESSIVQQYWGTPESRDYHWSTTLTLSDPRDTYLHLIARCGLVEYLATKLDREPADSNLISSLLTTSVKRFRIIFKRSEGTAFARKCPNLEVVGTLLDHSDLSTQDKSTWLHTAKETLASCQRHTRDFKSNNKHISDLEPSRDSISLSSVRAIVAGRHTLAPDFAAYESTWNEPVGSKKSRFYNFFSRALDRRPKSARLVKK